MKLRLSFFSLIVVSVGDWCINPIPKARLGNRSEIDLYRIEDGEVSNLKATPDGGTKSINPNLNYCGTLFKFE